MEDSIGFKSNLGEFTAPRAQSSQAPLLKGADEWKVAHGVHDGAVACCSFYIFLCRFLRTCEPQALVGTLERSEC